tara:strand:+ start:2390 stop:2920 length:531 start_codon:yes stop_codon:yes gene_type:complete
MGKRSDFERVERDFYPTPIEAVLPLVFHLPDFGLFAEPCAGDGRLVRHIEQLTDLKGYWMTDIEPLCDSVGVGNALADQIVGCDICITNPPWNRKILHPMIENLATQMPTWLLFDADWMHTKQSAPYQKWLEKVVSVGRVKWIEGSKSVGKDNCCWYLFNAKKSVGTPVRFYGRLP